MVTSNLPFVLPKWGNVPIYHHGPNVPIGFACVDDWLLGNITALGPWYLSDNRVAHAPRVILKLKAGNRKQLNLARCIAAIVKLVKDGKSGDVTDVETIWKESQNFPPIRFRDYNPFNCLTNNLVLGGHDLYSRLSLSQITVPEPTLLPMMAPAGTAPRSPMMGERVPDPVENVLDLESTDPLQAFPAVSDTIKDVRSILRGEK